MFHDLGDEDTVACMKGLENDGLVTGKGLDEGQWSLTHDAVDTFLDHSVWLITPGSGQVFAPRPGISLENCTQIELEMKLNEAGWVQMSLYDHQAHARQPLTQDRIDKIWYSDRNGRYFSNYLICLLRCEQLFEAGLTALYHGQIDAYYSAILSALDAGRGVALQSIAPYKPVTWPDMPNNDSKTSQSQSHTDTLTQT